MPAPTRNAEATKQRILEAALEEFAQHGIAGARVDRIARAAGCNKNLIYIYFASKDGVFATVLERNLTRVYDELAFTPGDLPGYAARVFDFAMANPRLLRLMAWAALEREPGATPARAASQAGKVAELAAAQEAGTLPDAVPPAALLTAVMALATAWSAASPFGPALDPASADDPAALREHVTALVARLAAPGAPEG